MSIEGIDISKYELDVENFDVEEVTKDHLLCLATEECDEEIPATCVPMPPCSSLIGNPQPGCLSRRIPPHHLYVVFQDATECVTGQRRCLGAQEAHPHPEACAYRRGCRAVQWTPSMRA